MKESPVKEANKQKKKRRKKKKKAKHQKQQQTETPNGDEASTPNTRTNEMTDYLQLWKDNRIEWKFRKKIQVLLLKCCYDEEKLPEEYFNTFVDYIKNLQGHSRKQTLEEAERIQKELGSETTKAKRAKRISEVMSQM